ncbi:hypothetical protein BBJ28_00002218 [Nothophytophthora sp. Chile5]|nr:hypothetical protein BBJ28_00002218 [Nothophytophthora sp. Chile5]
MKNDDNTEDGFPRIKLGSVARPVPGWDVQLLTADKSEDEHHGHHHESEEQDKELVVKLPLPPVVREVREQMGSFVCLKDVGMVTALPKTRSGKVMRATIQAIADSTPFRVPATIENAAVLDDIRVVLKELGYAKKKSVVVSK